MAPPAAIAVAFGGALCLTVAPNRDRADLARKFGPAARRCGFAIDIPLAAIPSPFVADVRVYAVDQEGRAGPLGIFKPGELFNVPVIRTAEDFVAFIQSPSTRLKDKDALLYTSVHALARFPDDFATGAAALCVIGYRLVLRETGDVDVKALFWRESRALLAARPAIPEGLYFRWHTSLRLVCGYLLYQDGAVDEAVAEFSAIRDLSHLLPRWPTGLTNVLLGYFLAGYLLHEKGERDRAKELWSQGSDVFRQGAALSVFANVYAFGELGNAVKVARECYVGSVVAETGKPFDDPALGPVGRTVDLRGLGIIAHLVHEKAVRRKAAASAPKA